MWITRQVNYISSIQTINETIPTKPLAFYFGNTAIWVQLQHSRNCRNVPIWLLLVDTVVRMIRYINCPCRSRLFHKERIAILSWSLPLRIVLGVSVGIKLHRITLVQNLFGKFRVAACDAELKASVIFYSTMNKR